MTEKLYEQNSYLQQFKAVVTHCDSAAEGKFYIKLDKTAFHPEGGGQPCDFGTLNGKRVTDVRNKDGDVVHTCEAAFAPGETVEGELDFERRFDFMQQHSGEHIVSGIIKSLYGFENVGFHLGEEMVAVDFDGELSDEQVAQVEIMANEAVLKRLPFEVSYPGEQALAALNIRSKVNFTQGVRVVNAGGIDLCACSGTHVNNTGDIFMVKIFTREKNKLGTRLSIMCGGRAFRRLQQANGELAAIAQNLSVKPLATAAAVEQVKNEAALLKQKLAATKQELYVLKAAAYSGAAGNIFIVEKQATADDLRRYAMCFADVAANIICIFSPDDAGGYRYVFYSAKALAGDFSRAFNAKFAARGGGKAELVQGSGNFDLGEAEKFVAQYTV